MTGADDRRNALRFILRSHYVKFCLCFVAAFVSVWMVGALPQSVLFWTILDPRFAADERYQLQRLFLPDLERRIPVVIIGDAMFHLSVRSPRAMPSDAESIVINGYDANDLRTVFKGLRSGMRYTETSVCSLIIQVSPLFMVRSKELHERHLTGLIKEVKVSTSLRRRLRDLFGILQAWAETENTMPAITADARRPATVVGQAQFADVTRENWNLAFESADKFDGQIIAVLDTSGTQWPVVSDLVEESRRGLESLADGNEMISWTTLQDFDAEHVLGCPS